MRALHAVALLAAFCTSDAAIAATAPAAQPVCIVQNYNPFYYSYVSNQTDIARRDLYARRTDAAAAARRKLAMQRNRAAAQQFCQQILRASGKGGVSTTTVSNGAASTVTVTASITASTTITHTATSTPAAALTVTGTQHSTAVIDTTAAPTSTVTVTLINPYQRRAQLPPGFAKSFAVFAVDVLSDACLLFLYGSLHPVVTVTSGGVGVAAATATTITIVATDVSLGSVTTTLNAVPTAYTTVTTVDATSYNTIATLAVPTTTVRPNAATTPVDSGSFQLYVPALNGYVTSPRQPGDVAGQTPGVGVYDASPTQLLFDTQSRLILYVRGQGPNTGFLHTFVCGPMAGVVSLLDGTLSFNYGGRDAPIAPTTQAYVQCTVTPVTPTLGGAQGGAVACSAEQHSDVDTFYVCTDDNSVRLARAGMPPKPACTAQPVLAQTGYYF